MLFVIFALYVQINSEIFPNKGFSKLSVFLPNVFNVFSQSLVAENKHVLSLHILPPSYLQGIKLTLAHDQISAERPSDPQYDLRPFWIGSSM